jgi:two-component system phosphate regulon sensor histidine kinase PhoR
MKTLGIQWKLFPASLLMTILTLGAMGFYASATYRRSHLDQVAADLRDTAVALGHRFEPLFEEKKFEEIDPILKSIGRKTDFRITVILPSGEVIGDSDEHLELMDNHAGRPEITEALSGKTGRSLRYSKTLEKNMMYLAWPLQAEGSKVQAVIRTSIPLGILEEARGRFVKSIFIGGVFIIGAAVLLNWLISRTISRPLEQMRIGAERFSVGDFTNLLKIEGTTETEALSRAMNRMARGIDQKIRELSDQRHELEAVFSSMSEGVIAVDTTERVLSLNSAAKRIFGIGGGVFRGRQLVETIRNVDLHKIVSRTLKEQKNLEIEFEAGIPEKRRIKAHTTMWRSNEGEVLGVLVVLQDITRIKKLENLRRDFVANVSHELKTPVTSIKGYVETLLEGALSDKENARHFLEIIARQTDRLNNIIEDLLTLSRLEQNRIGDKVKFRQTGVREILKSAIEMCSRAARDKKIDIRLECAENWQVLVNPVLFEQAVVNLVDNAVKYSEPQKEVNVSARKNRRSLEIRIVDCGVGIPQSHIPRLFERFYRIDKARSRKLGGTGLGLAIVKHIVQAHRGDIAVESRPGHGSTFIITLPLS